MNWGVEGAFAGAADALGTAVLHGLWQGAVIGLVAACLLAAMSRRSAQARYLVACLALATMLTLFLGTFLWALRAELTPASDSTTTSAAPNAGPTLPADYSASVVASLPTDAGDLPADPGFALRLSYDEPVIVPRLRDRVAFPGLSPLILAVAWLIGFGVTGLHALLQVAGARRLRRAAIFDIDDPWRRAFEALARTSRAARIARLGHSAAVEVPTVLGWLAPVLLVPLSAPAGLSPAQLSGILAHELAHISRRDYLVNALQTAAESALFFHPVAWWLSHRIRVEREYCCDDAAVRITGSALIYARALSELETLRSQRRQLALGANGGSLMRRITRIVGLTSEGCRLSTVLGALGALSVAMVVAIGVLLVSDDVGAEPGGAETPAAKSECDQLAERLAAMVKAGEITQAQADKKLAGCREGRGKLTCEQLAERLAAAVAAGEITQAQADEKLAGCREGAVKLTCEQLAERLAAAVAAGRITQAQADEKLAGCREGGEKLTCEQLAERLAAAVAAGRITQAQADEKLAGCRVGGVKLTCEQLAERLAAAVAAGQITQAQADEKLAGCRSSGEKLTCEQIAERLAAMVKAGEITQEQADEKLAGCRDGGEKLTCEQIAERLAAAVAAGEITQAQADEKLAGCREGGVKLTCEQIAERLAAMVKAGEITQAQADEKLAGCRRGGEKLTCEQIAERLAAAVAAGEITQAQADEKLADCREGGEKLTCEQLAERLAAMVKAGEITQTQADEKLAGCRDGGEKLTCEQLAERLAAMVKAGEITQTQADEKLAGCRDGGEKLTCEQLAERLAAAVAAGRITQAQADEKLAGCRTGESAVKPGT